MDLVKMIRELKAEEQRLDESIAALESLSRNRRRPGRPTKWLTEQIRHPASKRSEKPLKKRLKKG
jgi:hypothetical protein